MNPQFGTVGENHKGSSPVATLAPTGQYANFLEEAVETSSNDAQFMQKLEGFVKWAKANNQFPDTNSLLSSVCSLTAKHSEPNIRRSYVKSYKN